MASTSRVSEKCVWLRNEWEWKWTPQWNFHMRIQANNDNSTIVFSSWLYIQNHWIRDWTWLFVIEEAFELLCTIFGPTGVTGAKKVKNIIGYFRFFFFLISLLCFAFILTFSYLNPKTNMLHVLSFVRTMSESEAKQHTLGQRFAVAISWYELILLYMYMIQMRHYVWANSCCCCCWHAWCAYFAFWYNLPHIE